MGTKLKRCRNCDSSELAMAMAKVGTRSTYCVICTLCGAQGSHGKTEAAARRLWNTRKGEK